MVYSRQPDAWSFTQDGTEISVAVHGRVRVSAAEGLRAAVLADIGLTVTSDWMFAPELASGAVRRLLQAWTLPNIDLWAVFPTGRMASAKARRFADFVQAAMAGTARPIPRRHKPYRSAPSSVAGRSRLPRPHADQTGPATTRTRPMARFDTYRDAFPNARLTRKPNGVLEVMLHTEGGKLVFDGLTHEQFVDLFHAIGEDRDNRR